MQEENPDDNLLKTASEHYGRLWVFGERQPVIFDPAVASRPFSPETLDWLKKWSEAAQGDI